MSVTVLIITHGPLPAPNRPTAGVALRAQAHLRGLEARGYDVHIAHKSFSTTPQVHAFAFQTGAQLRNLTAHLKPDVILAVAPEEIPHVAGLKIPIIADLYAPRILEAQFETAGAEAEISAWLGAISKADGFLVSNARQVHYVMGLFPLAGVRCEGVQLAVVPLSIPEIKARSRRKSEPQWVAGGVFWPWQKPQWALQYTLVDLKKRGRGALHLFGGQYPLAPAGDLRDPTQHLSDSSHLVRRDFMAYDELLHFYSGCHGAIDVMENNGERALALSFRQMDWLACGVPIITGAYAPLAPLLEEFGAGFAIEVGDEAALSHALDRMMDPKAHAALIRGTRQLAKAHFTTEKTSQGLHDLIQQLKIRKKGENVWIRRAREYESAAIAEAKLNQMARERDDLRQSLAEKDLEIRRLNLRAKRDARSLSKLSHAIESALSFRQAELTGALIERDEELILATELRRELALKEKEIAQKLRQIDGLSSSRETLKANMAVAEKARQQATGLQLEAEATAQAAQAENRQLLTQVQTLGHQLAQREGELRKKAADLRQEKAAKEALKADVEGAQAQLRADNARLLELERTLRGQLEHATASWKATHSALSQLREENDILCTERTALHSDIEKKDNEFAQLHAERLRLEGVIQELNQNWDRLNAQRGRGLSNLMTYIRKRKR